MSAGTSLRFDQAYTLADHVTEALAHSVERLEAVGSLRRPLSITCIAT